MTARMTAARLAEIDERRDLWCTFTGDLLAELREVTRERDAFEAQRDYSRRSFASLKLVADKVTDQLFATEKERDKLKQELAELDAKAGNEYAIVCHYKDERDALRAENAKLQAVADAARALVAKHSDDCEHTAAIWDALAALEQKGKGV